VTVVVTGGQVTGAGNTTSVYVDVRVRGQDGFDELLGVVESSLG
jgi:hypothetical protein